MRIVTLLPSATEIVCALGLEDKLVGISHSCDYPPSVRRLPVVTSTLVPYTAGSDVIDSFVRDHLTENTALYELDMQALEAAAPDVIISQALCDVCAVSTGDVLSALDSLPSRPTLIDLEPNTLDEVFDDCVRVGHSLGHRNAASRLLHDLRTRRSMIAERTASIAQDERPKVAFLEWLMPPFNGGHWNPEMVALAGGIDLLGAPGQPSYSMTWDHVVASEPDVLFIACCGFSKDRTLDDIRKLAESESWNCIPAVANGKVFVADGNAHFSRPGPRLMDGLEIMAHALHPDVHPVSTFGSCYAVVS